MNTLQFDQFGLGRLPQPPDPRDFIWGAAETEEVREWRYFWDYGWRGDQGRTPQCTAYGMLHLVENGPRTWAPRSPGGLVMNPADLYRLAQELDEIPGTNYDGSTTRGVCKAAKQLGLIGSYWWVPNAPSVIDAIVNGHPVLIGVPWYTGMFTPNSEGVIKPTGRVEGGHLVFLNGANRKRQMIRGLNSWGMNWGVKGRFWMHQEDLNVLVTQRWGEAVVCLEPPVE